MRPPLISGRFSHDLWVAFFVIIVAVGFFMGHGLVIGFGVMGLLATIISLVWNRLALEEVSYERRLPQRSAFVGEVVQMTVTLTNRKPLPLAWVRVDDDVPDALQVVHGDVNPQAYNKVQSLHHSTSMAWYERIRWDYRLLCTRRGLYHIGPARFESGDPFGFLRSRKREPHRDSLLVYPRVVPLDELGIPADRPLGDVRGGIRIFQDPTRPWGLRDYQRGDPLKTMDWKATAKAQRLQVRNYEPSSSFTVILVVAVDTSKPYWAAYSTEALERVVTAAASVAGYAAEQHYSVGLFSNDMPIQADRAMTVPPSRGRGHLSVILGALATTRAYAVGPMATQLAQYAGRFPMGATLAVTTAFLPPEFVSTLGLLKGRGYKIVVFYVGDEPCPKLAEGIVVHELKEHLAKLEAAHEPVAV